MSDNHNDHHEIDECSPLTPASVQRDNSQQTPINHDGLDEIPTPLCSVLNTVIDYMMKPPTLEFEPEEFRQAQPNHNVNKPFGTILEARMSDGDLLPLVDSPTSSSVPVLVPVLRVFGPILRRDCSVNHPPVQSSCLHIHGAYPYLLARPRLAGPDGSIHQKVSHLSRNDQKHLDWDDPAAVERSLPLLRDRLESNIQATTASFGANNNNNNNNSEDPDVKAKTIVSERVVRRLSVVMGRGFYTYCQGPPAPFIRVEYYNPDDRWKVKRCLERGLDALPPYFHPDPFQYDPFGKGTSSRKQQPASTLVVDEDDDYDTDSDSEVEIPELLQFHCYEAHIPYTMQLFKDWNLAGMSYIHIKDGLFRNPLPKSIRPHHHPSYMKSCDEERRKVPSEYLFLDSNTLSGKKWSQCTEEDDSKARNSLSSSNMTAPETFNNPPTKDTSCDVELDISVENILNILDVMTELPEDKEERDRVHWRAVPSLREIWKEERRRMSKLLPPANDFLSQAPKPAFTLAVKEKDTPMPGTRLAVSGMKSLLRVSEGLEESFERCMKQIVDRYVDKVEEIDQRLSSGMLGANASSVYAREEMPQEMQLTPTFDETMDALKEMGDSENLGDQYSSQRSEEDGKDLAVDALAFNTPLNKNNRSSVTSEEKFLESTRHYYDPKRFSLSHEHDEEFAMSQRMEEGEAIVHGPFGSTGDFIDPETLRPYELVDDEDSIVDDDHVGADSAEHELELEKELSMMATQTLEPNEDEDAASPPLFRRDSYQDDESLSDEELLTDPADAPSAELGLQNNITQHKCHPFSSHPPTRAQVVNSAMSTRLLPLPPKRGAPDWLRHLHVYNNERRRWASPRANLHNWFPEKSHGFASLTRCAPSRRLVCSWIDKKSRKLPGTHGSPMKKARVSAKDELMANMTVDDNSRRLVAAVGDNLVGGGSSHDETHGRQVEEVDWAYSQQPISQNLSQNSSQRDAEQIFVPSQEVSEECTGLAPSTGESGSGGMSSSLLTSGTPQSGSMGEDALGGMGNAGGKLWVAGGGQIKAKTRPSQIDLEVQADSGSYLPTPISVMSIEVHVQCRTGRAGVNDSKQISMVPNSERDKTTAIAFVVARDPGGGECLQYLERGCIYVPVEREIPAKHDPNRKEKIKSAADRLRRAIPLRSMGIASPVSVECVEDERSLLLRFAAKVRARDPDMLLSWDTQGAGIGYLIERGVSLGQSDQSDSGTDHGKQLDMVKLLGRAHNTGGSAALSQIQNVFGSSASDKETADSSKVKSKERWKGSGMGSDWDERVGAGVAAASIPGRLVFASWKLVAEEVKHGNASYLPAIVSAVLGRRIPFHDNLILTNWYGQNRGLERWRVLHHRLMQATCSLMLFDALDIIGRAGEAARLSGVEFLHSFPGIRGSQYKVEGVLLRALKSLNSFERGSKRGKQVKSSSSSLSESTASHTQSPWKARRQRSSAIYGEEADHFDGPIHELNDRGYFFYSPSLSDTDRQEALEVQALTLEPESGHYEDPIVVCDFTALYPSLIIAYNLCYSTCAGKLEYHSTRDEMRMEGRTTGSLGPFTFEEGRTATVLKHHLKSLAGTTDGSDRAYVAPTGTIYVAESVVKGVLPQVLDEMLSTRAMLKKAAKEYKRLVPDISTSILRQLEARQLALKYVANVTYGYTSATFSGRCAMPLLADSIVECARRTLKNAINLANSWGAETNGRWNGAKVLYGDTDSVFVRLPGRSVDEAFLFGEEFCKAVTASNPPPVQLKLEKVYLGSILQTKKKYCGMKFESRNQTKPEFEAKGIETIRRDQCALTQKVLRNSLVTLFNKGMEAVKTYLYRQWGLIISGELPVSDFILTGRVRSRYRGSGIGPVQAVLARRLSEADPSRVMRHKERITYVIVATPGRNFRLRDGVLTPNEYLEQFDAYVLNTQYYITKHVNPALQRCLGLNPHKIDVAAWFNSMPKPRRRVHFWPTTLTGSTGALSRFFANSNCALCGGPGRVIGEHKVAICDECRSQSLEAMETAFRRLNLAQNESLSLAKQCSSCHLGHEDGGTYAVLRPSRRKRSQASSSIQSTGGVFTPLAACSCIDCPVSFRRHRLREAEYGATELCRALGANESW